mgnify:FL=1
MPNHFLDHPYTCDVMFYEAFAEEEAALRRFLPATCRAGFTEATLQAAAEDLPPAPLLSIRTQSVVPETWFPRVHGLLARTTGYDHLQRYRALAPPPGLACLPEYCSRAVAEQAALLWLALLRRLPSQISQWPRFDRSGLTGGECLGRRLVVAGVGRIGHDVIQIGRGLGMDTVGVDVVARHPDVRYLPGPEAFAQADVVAACMDLNPTSRHFFRAETFRSFKPGSLLVNVARGELVHTPDLIHALDQGLLGGAALDVFDDETCIADTLRGLAPPHPEVDRLRQLAGHPRVILTPHNAFNTSEAVERKSQFSAEQVVHFLQHRQFRWPWPGA